MIPNGLLTGVFRASCSVQRSSRADAVRPIPATVRTVFCCADSVRAPSAAAVTVERNWRLVVMSCSQPQRALWTLRSNWALARQKREGRHAHDEPERGENQPVAEHQPE